jgi:MFS superfamily sulfate permease-like transporter
MQWKIFNNRYSMIFLCFCLLTGFSGLIPVPAQSAVADNKWYFLPKAVLGATIIVTVLSLVDLASLKRTYKYSKADFATMAATILVTWVEGIEIVLIAGVGLSIFLHLYKTSRPHVAVVGQFPVRRLFAK